MDTHEHVNNKESAAYDYCLTLLPSPVSVLRNNHQLQYSSTLAVQLSDCVIVQQSVESLEGVLGRWYVWVCVCAVVWVYGGGVVGLGGIGSVTSFRKKLHVFQSWCVLCVCIVLYLLSEGGIWKGWWAGWAGSWGMFKDLSWPWWRQSARSWVPMMLWDILLKLLSFLLLPGAAGISLWFSQDAFQCPPVKEGLGQPGSPQFLKEVEVALILSNDSGDVDETYYKMYSCYIQKCILFTLYTNCILEYFTDWHLILADCTNNIFPLLSLYSFQWGFMSHFYSIFSVGNRLPCQMLWILPWNSSLDSSTILPCLLGQVEAQGQIPLKRSRPFLKVKKKTFVYLLPIYLKNVHFLWVIITTHVD